MVPWWSRVASEQRSTLEALTENLLVNAFKEAWHDADRQGLEGSRTRHGIRAVIAMQKELER